MYLLHLLTSSKFFVLMAKEIDVHISSTSHTVLVPSCSTNVEQLQKTRWKCCLQICSVITDGPCVVPGYFAPHVGKDRLAGTCRAYRSSDKAGFFTLPSNWTELRSALLECCMPSNSVEESSLRLANYKEEAHKTVSV